MYSTSPPAPSQSVGPLRGLLRLGSLPVAAATMTLITAVYYTLVAFNNLVDFDTNQVFVQNVLGMTSVFTGEEQTWRDIDTSAAQNAAYVLIIAWEVLLAAVLIAALVSWLVAFRRSMTATAGGVFDVPRRLASLGYTMVLLLFAGGFIAIGGEWFLMWQSSEWNGLAPALQNVTIAGLALIITHLPSPDWTATRPLLPTDE
jgi:predicted small integral membrane protein